jgi:hypothetical protein
MNLSIDNLGKKDNARWKKIADYLLYTGLPALNVALASIQPVSPEFTIYAMAISNLLIALFKGATKFTTETPQV